MKRNQVVLLYGLPASGKYTIAKQIQEKCVGKCDSLIYEKTQRE